MEHDVRFVLRGEPPARCWRTGQSNLPFGPTLKFYTFGRGRQKNLSQRMKGAPRLFAEEQLKQSLVFVLRFSDKSKSQNAQRYIYNVCVLKIAHIPRQLLPNLTAQNFFNCFNQFHVDYFWETARNSELLFSSNLGSLAFLNNFFWYVLNENQNLIWTKNKVVILSFTSAA